MEWTNGFYRDSERGESAGNILGAVAALFPPAVGERISSREPIPTCWRLMVRTMKDGPVRHFIWTEPEVLARLKRVFDEVYQGYPCEEDGPFFFAFNEGYRDGWPMVCVSLAKYKPRLTVCFLARQPRDVGHTWAG
jgi:hypothetical protein